MQPDGMEHTDPIPDPREQPTTKVEAAGKALGLGRASSYAAAQRGELPTIRIGRRLLVPTAALRRMVGLDQGEAAGPDAA